ncbi:MAG: magnesium transporter [Deferribacterales bacterium]|nr:magnesium transporter [Deferribacterales bacterium]
MDKEKELEMILDLVASKKYVELKEILKDMNEVDLADILNEIEAQTAVLLFRMLPKGLAVDVFAHLTIERQKEIINVITDKELKYIVEELYFDDMIDLLEEMPANVVNKILLQSNKDERDLINQFLKYPEDSAGSIMTIEYVDLKKKMTVKEALQHIKETGLTKETVYTCYVTDENRKLEGIISLRKLVTSELDQIIEDIMERDVIYVNTHDDQETVANIFRKYGFLALPVVDNENRLTGIITVDDIMDVMEQEATEDFQKMAAMAPSDEAYLESSVFELARHRIFWLLILMVSATISGSIINGAEEVLTTMIVLNSFIPMLMDTAGNSGSQSSTLVIRGLATGEIEMGDFLKVLWKEFRISIVVGIVLAFVNFLRLYYLVKVDFSIAILVCLTLIVTIVISKLLGGTLPLVAKKFKIDPAIMAGPLITTIADATSLTIYFYLAKLILQI